MFILNLRKKSKQWTHQNCSSLFHFNQDTKAVYTLTGLLLLLNHGQTSHSVSAICISYWVLYSIIAQNDVFWAHTEFFRGWVPYKNHMLTWAWLNRARWTEIAGKADIFKKNSPDQYSTIDVEAQNDIKYGERNREQKQKRSLKSEKRSNQNSTFRLTF